jgi:hypothetical protein
MRTKVLDVPYSREDVGIEWLWFSGIRRSRLCHKMLDLETSIDPSLILALPEMTGNVQSGLAVPVMSGGRERLGSAVAAGGKSRDWDDLVKLVVRSEMGIRRSGQRRWLLGERLVVLGWRPGSFGG